MSNIGGGIATSQYDNLSALLEFVKSPDYLNRIRELRDLEDSSRTAKANADEAMTKVTKATDALNKAKADHETAAAKLAADQAAHSARVARWNSAMIEVQKAMQGG